MGHQFPPLFPNNFQLLQLTSFFDYFHPSLRFSRWPLLYRSLFLFPPNSQNWLDIFHRHSQTAGIQMKTLQSIQLKLPMALQFSSFSSLSSSSSCHYCCYCYSRLILYYITWQRKQSIVWHIAILAQLPSLADASLKFDTFFFLSSWFS